MLIGTLKKVRYDTPLTEKLIIKQNKPIHRGGRCSFAKNVVIVICELKDYSYVLDKGNVGWVMNFNIQSI